MVETIKISQKKNLWDKLVKMVEVLSKQVDWYAQNKRCTGVDRVKIPF